MIQENGPYKLVTDVTTMKTHKVPIKDIVEHGLDYADLKYYPLAEN